MTNDRELLEAAAKAAGIEIHESDDGTMQRRPIWAITHYVQGQPYGEHRWDPRHDAGQALQLAAKLRIDVSHNHPADQQPWVAAERQGCEGCFDPVCVIEDEFEEKDRCAATCLAIVRAAAALAPTP